MSQSQQATEAEELQQQPREQYGDEQQRQASQAL